MVSVGYAWFETMSRLGMMPSVFADDWSWHGDQPKQHLEALLATQRFLVALKFHSDPRKCWCWGTDKAARKAWDSINEQVMGLPTHYKISLAERELGVFMRYKSLSFSQREAIRHELTLLCGKQQYKWEVNPVTNSRFSWREKGSGNSSPPWNLLALKRKKQPAAEEPEKAPVIDLIKKQKKSESKARVCLNLLRSTSKS